MNYTKEQTVFNGQKNWKLSMEPGKYTVRFIREPQPIKLTHFDETGKVSSVTIVSKEKDEQRPIFDMKNDTVVDDLPIRQHGPENFMIVKPLERDFVHLDLQWGSNTLPIMLPKEFFTFNEPIEILTGNWKLPDTQATSVIEPALSPEGGEAADPDNSMVMTEVSAAAVEGAGLAEGAHKLENVYDKKDFIKSLCNNAIGGGGGSVVNNLDLLRDFFPGEKFYLKKYNGKYFVVFKGVAGTRTIYKGTKYALKNPKVMALSVAKGPAAGTGAALKGLKSGIRGNVLTVVIVGAVDLVAWNNGMLSDDGKFISDFIVEFGMDIFKAGVSAIATGFLFGICLMFGVGATATTLPVFVIVFSGIVVSVAIGMVFDYIDEKRGYSNRLRNHGNEVEKVVTRALNENLVEPVCRILYDLERHIEQLYLSNCKMPFPL